MSTKMQMIVVNRKKKKQMCKKFKFNSMCHLDLLEKGNVLGHLFIWTGNFPT